MWYHEVDSIEETQNVGVSMGYTDLVRQFRNTPLIITTWFHPATLTHLAKGKLQDLINSITVEVRNDKLELRKV